jgi:hypothetical protein
LVRFVVAAILVAWGDPQVALAGTVEENNHDPLSWGCAWSVFRWLILAAFAVSAWLLLFHYWFPSRLAAPVAPWPMDAFGDALALFVMALVGGFVVVFAVISDELTMRPLQVLPGGNRGLNRHFLWILILLGGLLVSATFKFIAFRHRRS